MTGEPLVVTSPLAGRVVPLSDVPDLVFAEEMVGPGLAVEPDPGPGTVVSPVDGQVGVLHAHAFAVQTAAGRGVLVHLGIDTVQLQGEGFELLVAKGDEIAAGTPVVRWDPSAVAAAGRSAVCPVVALDAPPGAVERLVGERAEAGTELFRWS